MKCETCCGTGIVLVLINTIDYHINGCEPIYEEQACEDCGAYEATTEEPIYAKPVLEMKFKFGKPEEKEFDI